MSQGTLLLEYHKCDEIISEYNRFKKQSKTRAELLKLQEAITAQQAQLAGFDTKATEIRDAIDKLNEDKNTITGKLKAEIAKIQSGTVTEAQVDRMSKNAADMKAELEAILAKLDAFVAELKELETNVEPMLKQFKASKSAYVELKKRYDEEIGDSSEKSKKAKDARTALEEKIAPENLTLYKSVRNTKGVNAVAGVEGNVCKGCGMKIPQAQLNALKEGRLSVCESCGKILCPGD